MKVLLGVWAGLDLLILAAGILLITFSTVWRTPSNAVLRLLGAFFNFDLTIALGSLYLAAAVVSVPAILSPKNSPTALKLLTAYLICLAIITLAIGTVIWVFSLEELDNVSDLWGAVGQDLQRELQDQFQCCGYWNGTTAGQFSAARGICSDVAVAAAAQGCMNSVTTSVDFFLNTAFTAVYGFEAVVLCLALATGCIINERAVIVRFKRIDEKRGGGGFV